MSPLLTIFIGSVAGLTLWSVLLGVEERRGARIVLAGVRQAFDGVLRQLESFIGRLTDQLGRSAFRQLLQFVVHAFLQVLLFVVRGLEFLLRKLQRTNRQVVRSIEHADADTHLSEVKHHTDSFKLSDEEKRQRRRELLR